MRNVRVVQAALLAGVASVSMARCAAAQSTPAIHPITFADLMAMRRVADPQVSPSGKWVLFAVTDVSLEKNSKTTHLWAVPLDGSARESQVTSGTGESEGRFSPDGKWVMYASTTMEGKSEIYVAPWDEAKGSVGRGRAVTALETEADGGTWAADSKHFVFTSDVYPECESHKLAGAQHNEEEAACNAAKDAEAAKNPVKAMIFTELLYRHWDHFQGPKRSHIFYASVGAPRVHVDAPKDLTPMSVIGDHVVPTFTVGGPQGYALSPDGSEIAYEVNLDKAPAESTNNDIYVLKVDAAPRTIRKVSVSPGSDDGPQYSPDGKWLAWRSQARNGYESDKFDLVVMDRATGEMRTLTKSLDDWVDEFAWAADSGALYYASPYEGAEPVGRVSLDSGEVEGYITKTRGEYGSLAVASNGAIVAVSMAVNAPAEVIALHPDDTHSTTEQSRLTHVNDALIKGLDMPDMEPFWFTGAGKTKVEGFLLRPPNFDARRKYPVKFLIHGGPQGAWGDAWSYRWNPELFAANGYVVVMVNPRGSTGYGQKFLEQVSGDWGGRPYVDLMKGMDYAELHYPFLDRTRECALGASYGGFMADWVLTHTNRFKCIVTHDGMYNPQSAFGTTEELWFNEWEFRPLDADTAGVENSAHVKTTRNTHEDKLVNTAGEEGDSVVEQTKRAHPWDFYDVPASEDPFRKWSPMYAIKNAHTPTLVVHSQRDYRLDVSEGYQLFTALQVLGVPSKMLYFPDEGHWVLKPRNSQLWNETVSDWCDRWLGMNRYAAVGPERNPAAVAEGQGTSAKGQWKSRAGTKGKK